MGTDSQGIRQNKKKVPAGEVDRKWERDGLTKVYFQYYFKWAPKGQGCVCQGLIKKKGDILIEAWIRRGETRVFVLVLTRKSFLLEMLSRRRLWDYAIAGMHGPGRRV